VPTPEEVEAAEKDCAQTVKAMRKIPRWDLPEITSEEVRLAGEKYLEGKKGNTE
jgi:hypothetical protein